MKKKSSAELIQYIKESNYTDIIFDCDETILHLIIDWSYAHEKYQELSRELWLEKEYDSMGVNEFLEFVLVEKWLDHREKINSICRYCEDHYYSKTVLNHVLLNFIKEHFRDYNFYVLSNNMESTVYREIEKVWLEKCFKRIFCRDSLTFAKPNPEWINFVIDMSKAEKKDILMVWDNPGSDGRAAGRAGIDYCLIDMYI